MGEEEVAKVVGAKLVLKPLPKCLIFLRKIHITAIRCSFSSLRLKLDIETSEVSFLGPNMMPALLISTSTGLPS